MKTLCAWFALCDNETMTALDHPVLGPTPCCERCARQVGADTQLSTRAGLADGDSAGKRADISGGRNNVGGGRRQVGG
jgi:hypothetical protein